MKSNIQLSLSPPHTLHPLYTHAHLAAMQHQQYGIGDLPPHPLLAMLAASSATSQKVEQASSSSADSKEDGDSIESKLRSLKLTCHDPEHSDSAVSSEGSSGEDSRTQPRSVIDYYTSADTDDALSGAGELATLTIMAIMALDSVIQRSTM